MGLFDNNRSEEDQKLWNLIFYKMYATDKEVDEMAPVFAILMLLVFVGVVIYLIL